MNSSYHLRNFPKMYDIQKVAFLFFTVTFFAGCPSPNGKYVFDRFSSKSPHKIKHLVILNGEGKSFEFSPDQVAKVQSNLEGLYAKFEYNEIVEAFEEAYNYQWLECTCDFEDVSLRFKCNFVNLRDESYLALDVPEFHKLDGGDVTMLLCLEKLLSVEEIRKLKALQIKEDRDFVLRARSLGAAEQCDD